MLTPHRTLNLTISVVLYHEMNKTDFLVFLFISLPVPIIMIKRSYSCLVSAGNNFTLNAEISFSDSAVEIVSISLTISRSRDNDTITSNELMIMQVATQPPSPTHLLPPLIVV